MVNSEIRMVKREPSLREQAVEQIRQSIVTGALKPGSMHSEQGIAVQMSISRTPVREALLQLEREGLIEFVPQRGFRICSFDPHHLVQVLQFREALEGYCVSMLATHPKPMALARLDRELERQRAIIAAGDRLAWVGANMDFHSALVTSAGNRLFDETLPPLASHTMRIGFRMIARKERMQESLHEHAAVVEAIRKGDADGARGLIHEHLYVTTVLMNQLFSDLGLDLERAEENELGKR